MTPTSTAAKWSAFRHDDCPICGKRGWCSETTRPDGTKIVQCMHTHDESRPGWFKSKPNRAGEQCSYYNVYGSIIGPQPSPNGKHEPVDRAGETTCHAAYAALSEVLGLSADHHAALVARGLSESDITTRGYRTLPVGDRGPLAHRVLDLLASQGISQAELMRVPGFGHRADGIVVAGKAGLLIPVRDCAGNIDGMMIRPDVPGMDPRTGKIQGKYVWFTSSFQGGAHAKQMAHVPLRVAAEGADAPPGASGSTEAVRVTEGQLKADLATIKSGLLTLGLPGVGSWRLALPALKAVGTKQVRLAFDQDARTNPHVAGALACAARGLVAAGYELEAERWEPAHKGIDDALRPAATSRCSRAWMPCIIASTWCESLTERPASNSTRRARGRGGISTTRNRRRSLPTPS